MSTENPPIYQASIFNQAFFNDTVSSGGAITETYLASHYLKFPTAQSSTETIPLLTATTLTATNNAIINGLNIGKGNGNITDNTAFGVSALSSITGGSNTAIGYQTLKIGTTARFNTAVGAYALTASTTGDYNTAVGYQALTAANTGSTNTAVGAGSLSSTTTGSNNTALGQQAGGFGASSNTTGSNNTYIGYQTTSSANNFSNSTALGSGATITASNQIVLGTTSDSVRYNKLKPLYTTVPTYTADEVGYTVSDNNATASVGTTNTTLMSITLSQDGVYIIMYCLRASPTTGVALNFTTRLYINSAVAIKTDDSIVGSGELTVSPSTFRNISAGDVVEVRALTSNSSVSLQTGTSGQGYLRIVRIA